MRGKKDIEKFKLSELLLNEVNLIVISCDEKGGVTYISPASEKIIGYKPKELLKEKWWAKTFFSPEESRQSKTRVNDIISGEIKVNSDAYERKLRCKDGSTKWIEWRDSIGLNNKFVSVGVDIDNWKRTEEKIIQSDTIIKHMNSMVLVSDKSGKVLFVSPSVEKTLGFTADELMGDKWWEVTFEDKDEAIKHKEATFNYVFLGAKGSTDILRRKIKTRNGDFKWTGWRISKGVNDTYISVGRDISSRILTDIELKKAKEYAEESLKVKNEFLANMSHEIRTPLNAVIGFTDLLLETELSSEQQLHLETMRNSGDILLSLINDILDLSKLESNKLEVEAIPFDLHKQLNEVVRLMKIKANEKNISLDLIIHSNTPINVIGDPTRLGQILLNLIGNAIKFTNEGSVIVSVKKTLETPISSSVFFEIKDTGIGIVSNKINTVFGAFTQAKSDTSRIYGGTGLGLTIVKKLVNLLNGEIKVESKFGVGSVFKMTLPIKESNQTNKQVQEQEISLDQPLELNILLVDDNKTNQLLGKTRLERWKCNVDLASNGIEAVKKTQKKLYDVILMDIQMPIMDGYEATKIIKNDISEQVSKIPIIAMTAYTSKNDIKRAINAGMDDYIFKPFKPSEVYTLLTKYGKLIEEPIQINKDSKDDNSKIEKTGKKYIDLKFLREETFNESSLLILLIKSFIKDIKEFLEVLEQGSKTKNWILLYQAAHKIKPSIRMFGILKVESTIHVLSNKLKENKELEEDISDHINLCNEILKLANEELLAELKILENE